MPRQKIYFKGDNFSNFEGLIIWMREGNWVFWRDKPYHPSWIMNWQVRYLYRQFLLDRFHRAHDRRIQWIDKEEVIG